MIMKKIITASMLSLLLGGTVQAQSLPVYLDDSKPIEDRIEDALSRITVEEKVALIHAQSKFSSPGVARLGIPEFWMTDGPHGIRPEVLWDEWNQAGWTNDSCVAFPALTCLAATWNPEAALLYGQSIGEEARYRNKTVLLGPGVNIYRTPLNGRNFEYTRVPFSPRWKMLSAICAIFFSCRASATLIRSVACPSSQAILKSPTLFNPMM